MITVSVRRIFFSSLRRTYCSMFFLVIALLSYSAKAMEEDENSSHTIKTSSPQKKVETITEFPEEDNSFAETNCCSRAARSAQNYCYQVMARTFWDSLMQGFKPGRVIAIDALDITTDDKVLFIGEGSGLDFEVLPEQLNKNSFQAFDFSPEMVRQAKLKAPQFGIPEENCFIGDAQQLPFTEEKFDKIYFPLSLGSIPNPTLALKEAERVLAPKGKIVVMEKLIDDGYTPSGERQFLNLFTRCIFADINRNLNQMMGEDSPLKVIYYRSLENTLSGCFMRSIGTYYRVATLVRDNDYPEIPSCGARLNNE